MTKSIDNLSQRLFSRPNVTPYGGLLLVILISLMLTSTSPSGNTPNIEMPEARSSDFIFGDERRSLVIIITKEGEIFFNHKRIDLPQYLHILIDDRIEEMQEEGKVMLRVDKGVPFGRVQEVLKDIKSRHRPNRPGC